MSILNVIKVAAIAVVAVKVARFAYDFGTAYGGVTNALSHLQAKGYNLNDLNGLTAEQLQELAEQTA